MKAWIIVMVLVAQVHLCVANEKSFDRLFMKLTKMQSNETVLIPAGTYSIHSLMELNSLENITISAIDVQDSPNVVFLCEKGVAAFLFIKCRNVSLVGISFENCESHKNAISGGAAIYADSSGSLQQDNNDYDMIITNCWFLNCSSSAKYGVAGGAVCLNNTSALIKNCVFQGNRIIQTFAGTYSRGGAIAVVNSALLRIEDSIFSDNHILAGVGPSQLMLSAGGALGLDLINEVMISGCTFISNSVTAWTTTSASTIGGAIAFTVFGKHQKSMTVINSRFFNNSCLSGIGSVGYGGAIYSEGNILKKIFFDNTFINVSFIGNFAGSKSGINLGMTGSAALQGALYLLSLNQTILQNCIFENNTARGGDGLQGGGDSNAGAFSIRHAMFTSSETFIINCTVKNNRAIGGSCINSDAGFGDGGAATLGTTEVEVPQYFYIYDTVFSENKVISGNSTKGEISTSGGEGGAILLEGGSLIEFVFKNVTFVNNSVHGGASSAQNSQAHGGAMSAFTIKKLQFINCSFIDNFLDTPFYSSLGGALYLEQNDITTIDNCIFSNNQNKGHLERQNAGGAIFNSMGNLTITNTQFTNNKVLLDGHANNTIFAHSSEGGAVAVTCSNIQLDTVMMLQNWADVGGGLFLGDCVIDSNFTFQSSRLVFRGNNAFLGGAISLSSNASCITASSEKQTINETYFENNNAYWGGGSVHVRGQNCSIMRFPVFFDSVAQNNTAGFGGVFYFEDAMCLYRPFFVNATLLNNTAIFGGSVVTTPDIADASSINFCEDCLFKNNVASYQNEEGYATFVYSMKLLECPATQYLNNVTFLITVQIIDAYGTPIAGEYASFFQASLHLNGTNCKLYRDQESVAFNHEGIATFATNSLQGMNGSVCQLDVYTYSYKNEKIVTSCMVELAGCPPGSSLYQSAQFQDCRSRNVPFIVFVATLITATVILLCVVILVVVIVCSYYVKRKIKQHKNIPDLFDQSNLVKELMEDSEIKKIPAEEIERRDIIGKGAAGTVYRGKWKTKGANIAIKSVSVTLFLGDNDWIRAFLQETKIQSHLHHANILSLYGICVFNEQELGIIQPLMDRGSVDHLLDTKGRNIPDWIKLRLALGAAKGLQFLHRKRVMHRDIKPANILIDSDWSAKLADFGASIVFHLTRQHTIVGTPIFAAPEVLQGDVYNLSSDIYSLAVTLANIFTGKTPYSEPQYASLSSFQLIEKIIQEELRPDISILTKEYQTLLQECMSPNPKERPLVGEVYRRLRRLQGKPICIVTESTPFDANYFQDIENIDRDDESDHSDEEEIQNPVPVDACDRGYKTINYSSRRTELSVLVANEDNQYKTFG